MNLFVKLFAVSFLALVAIGAAGCNRTSPFTDHLSRWCHTLDDPLPPLQEEWRRYLEIEKEQRMPKKIERYEHEND